MRFGSIILATVLLLPSLSFADSKYYSGSTSNSQYKFNKKEKIILALPSYPTETEKGFVERVRQYLRDKKFTIVDSIQHADRILTFRITENSTMNFESSFQTAWMQDLKSGQESVQSGKIVSATKDSGYTFLEFSLQEISLIKVKKRSVVWQSFIGTKSENFLEYPEVLLDNVMKLYGKNEVKDGKIKKPKK